MTRYFVTIKKTGQERECPRTEAAVDAFFRLIADLTGLDRPMASTIMQSGQTVDHPVYSFWSSDAPKGVNKQ